MHEVKQAEDAITNVLKSRYLSRGQVEASLKDIRDYIDNLLEGVRAGDFPDEEQEDDDDEYE